MKPDKDNMSFLEHLEELRWHLIRAFIAIFCFSLLAFLSKHIIFDIILFAPSRSDFFTYQWVCALGEWVHIKAMCIEKLPFILQSRKLTGQFSMHITASLVAGVIVSFPYIFWEIWRFIQPALYSKEKNVSQKATFFVSLLFIMGVSFGYFIITPFSIYFLSNYQVSSLVMNEFDIISYVSTVITLIIVSGLIFQLPLLVYFLSYTGLVTPDLMKKYQKHAIIIILFLSAVITPPDIFSQIFISIPLILLYRISIAICSRVVKKLKEKENA